MVSLQDIPKLEARIVWWVVELHLRGFPLRVVSGTQIGVVILVTPKQEVERKSEWFCGGKFFAPNLK